MKTLEEIKKEYPNLRTNGFKYNDYDGGDLLKRPKEFEAVCKWLNDNIGKRKTIDDGISSYGLKHIVEDAIHHYVCNGILIASALACGYKMKHYRGPNCFFNMSYKDLKNFDRNEGYSGPPLDRLND
tara:strand:+ start:363 stop:743 length:381 start_codon:yes stop_codon:yes gene_type:complete